VHGIGFDNDNNISANRTFKLYGFQAWGILNYDTYPGDKTWRKFVIPVGQLYTGQFDRLFFVADNDSGTGTGDSYFRKIKIYEGTACQSLTDDNVSGALALPSTSTSLPEGINLNVAPNPASNEIKLSFRCKERGDATVQLYNIMGQKLKELPIAIYEGDNQERVNVADLPSGTYYVRIDTRVNQLISKFIVSR
jgi:Secretion system C-terminal sorting domain